MSISKEERERITRLAGTVDGQAARLLEFPEEHDTESRELASGAEALVSDARTLLSALGGVDERIAELQQENERLKESLANIIISDAPPTQADIDRAHELVERGDIED